MTHITRLPAPSADAISPDRPQWSGRSFVEVVMDAYRVVYRTIWFWQRNRYLREGWQISDQCFVWGRMIEAAISRLWPLAILVRPAHLPPAKPNDVVTFHIKGCEYVGVVDA